MFNSILCHFFNHFCSFTLRIQRSLRFLCFCFLACKLKTAQLNRLFECMYGNLMLNVNLLQCLNWHEIRSHSVNSLTFLFFFLRVARSIRCQTKQKKKTFDCKLNICLSFDDRYIEITFKFHRIARYFSITFVLYSHQIFTLH